MKPAPLARQRGVALLFLVTIVVLALTYLITSRLSSAAGRTVVDREHNGRVMSQAKRALIGWMVLNAAQTDNNPGRLPCPEGINSIGTTSEGIAAPTVTPSTPACATVGRLPWRTLGLDKLVDAAAQPLWYAVSPGWTLQNSSTLLTINSDSRGQMAVDGVAAPNEVIALIIAPGAAMNVAAAAGCTARNQVRSPAAPSMDALDYIECFDTSAATPVFSTIGPAASFNDQVITVTTADLIPALEAAIQQRMQREIAPALRGVYSSAQWGSQPLLPFATPFSNPGTSDYKGAAGTHQGLLPFTCSTAACAADAREPATPFVTWNTGFAPTVSVAGAILSLGGCSFIAGNRVYCSGTYVALGSVTLRMRMRANNVGMSLRQLNASALTIEHGLLACGSPGPGTAASATMQSDGSAELTLQGTAPGLLGGFPLFLPLTVNYCMTAELTAFTDHPLLDATSIGAGSTGWFVRNEWYRLVYYAAAPLNAPGGLAPGPFGCDATNCLRFNGAPSVRSLLVLTGRSLSNATRPSSVLADYLEHQNCDLTVGVCAPDTQFEQRPVRASKVAIPAINAPSNDRVVLVDWITPPTFPLAALP